MPTTMRSRAIYRPLLARTVRRRRLSSLAHIWPVLEAKIDQLRALALAVELATDGHQRADLPFQVVAIAEPHARPGLRHDGDARIGAVLELARRQAGHSREDLLELEHGREGATIDAAARLERLRADVMDGRQRHRPV